MARKPAQTKPAGEDKTNPTSSNSESDTAKGATTAAETKPAAAEAGTADAGAAGSNTDNQATNTAASTAAAPADAPATDDQGQTGGEDGSVLPATNDENKPEADLIVVCHHKGGRRRAGLRWDEGETRIVSTDLDDYALAQLRGDPQFTVLSIEKD